MLDWKMATLSELSSSQLFDILKLRVDVFVVEQQCAYVELDEYDCAAQTVHIAGLTAAGKTIACARMIPPGLYREREVTIGRVAINACHRGQGIARAMLPQLLDEAAKRWPGAPVFLSSQAYIVPFYETLGFHVISESYDEDGISHVDMNRSSLA